MYAGKIVEAASAEDLYHRPRHAYTLGLLRSVPRLDQARKEKLDPIEGMPPDLVRVPPGCSFRPRCRFAVDRCGEETPPLLPIENSRTSACWEWERVARATKPSAPAQ
jgi:oligopeptide/dipeptide ABC transporter ATP-binding protein